MNEQLLANLVRALPGKTAKIQTLKLIHSSGAYRKGLHRLRSFLMIAKSAKAYMASHTTQKKPILGLSRNSDVMTCLQQYEAAKAVAPGIDMSLPPCVSVAQACAALDWPVHSSDEAEITASLTTFTTSLRTTKGIASATVTAILVEKVECIVICIVQL